MKEIPVEPIWEDNLEKLQEIVTIENVDNEDEMGIRLIHKACLKTYPNWDVVDFLLSIGASIDFKVKSGLTFVEELSRSSKKNPEQESILKLVKKVELFNKLNAEIPNKSNVPKNDREKI